MPERSQGADCRRKRNKTDRFHVENGLFYVPSSLYGLCGGKYRRTPGRSALAEKNRGLFGWVADKVNEITGRINDAYDEIDLSDDIGVYEAARIFQRSENEIRERWNKLLVTANENKAAENVTGKKISAGKGVQYQRSYITIGSGTQKVSSSSAISLLKSRILLRFTAICRAEKVVNKL
ncbi:MAG: hypothetical protein IJH48_00765 [Oscillospiraceae bacterium]|nr:hypothetical protein [Oscillospiraceae bacterium]